MVCSFILPYTRGCVTKKLLRRYSYSEYALFGLWTVALFRIVNMSSLAMYFGVLVLTEQ